MSAQTIAALALAALCGIGCSSARAGEDELAFKLTFGRYASSDGNPALDVNLRATQGDNTAWLGVYKDRVGFRQWRSGYEHHFDGDWLRTVLSLQSASGGVAVGAVTSELGGETYAIAGFGRTNVRNYVNLNYDPNDAITLGLGTRAFPQTELTLFQVRDDRLHTGQQVTHLVARRRFDGDQRLTLDLFAKRGLTGDGVFVNDRSWLLGYDRGALFVRFAHDPHAGFTSATQNRFSFGTRF